MVALKVLQVFFVTLSLFVFCNILIFSAENKVTTYRKVHVGDGANTSEQLICTKSVYSLYSGIRPSERKCTEEVKSNKSNSDQTINYKYTFDKNITYADDVSQWQLFIHKEGKYKILLRSVAFPDSRKFLRDTPCIRLLVLTTEKVPGHIWKELE